jgi:hypothetical protein
LDIAKNVDSQLTTSVESGGDGGDDKESIIDEDGDGGEGIIMADDEGNFKSSCSRSLLKRKTHTND